MANNPISNIDAGGNLIIFVSGYWPGNRHVPYIKRRTYWDAQLKADAVATIGDREAVFFNGTSTAVGGALSLVLDCFHIEGGSTALGRYEEGQAAAQEQIQFFRDELDLEKANGGNGKLNFVAHSMGVAYATGMINVLKNAKDKDGNNIFSPEEFGDAYYFAGYQTEEFPAQGVGNELQFSHTNDVIARANKINLLPEGNFHATKFSGNGFAAHSNGNYDDAFKTKGAITAQPHDAGEGHSPDESSGDAPAAPPGGGGEAGDEFEIMPK